MAVPIGILACSAEGAALCYRTICTEAPTLLGQHAHPELSMHTHSLDRYVCALEKGDLAAVADLMLDSAQKLARAGAAFLICPDNTIHAALPFLAGRCPLPFLHIGEVVAAEAAASGYRCLGLTGTRWLVEGDVYPKALSAAGLAWHRPDQAARIETDRIIMEELVAGRIEPRSKTYLQQIVDDLRQAGCDAVVLGCTELPLILEPGATSLPLLDSTRLLARAALRHAIVEGA